MISGPSATAIELCRCRVRPAFQADDDANCAMLGPSATAIELGRCRVCPAFQADDDANCAMLGPSATAMELCRCIECVRPSQLMTMQIDLSSLCKNSAAGLTMFFSFRFCETVH